MIKDVRWSSRNSLFLSDFKSGTWIFSADFQKILISNLMKILPMGAKVFHAYRRTKEWTDGHDEANGRFLQFCERAYKPIVDCGNGKTSLFFLKYIKTNKYSVGRL
jgi:hypothetical protein